MVSIAEFLLGIRHPIRAYFHIKRLIRIRKTYSKHKFRIKEYSNFLQPVERAISFLATELTDIDDLRDEIKNKDLEKTHSMRLSSIERHPWYDGAGLPYPIAEVLYVICRILKPSKVVETGVAYGVSSHFMLEALRENDREFLYSIDMPRIDKKAASLIGALVPSELRDRWLLIKGNSLKELPSLLNRLGNIDIFLHDSEHTYECMIKEFSCAWKHLTHGGLLMADDVDYNDAFIDFCERESVNLIIIQAQTMFGIVKEP